MPFGVWTVCCHHNVWSPSDIYEFRQNLYRYKKNITEFDQVVHDYKNCKKQWIDSALSQLFLSLVRLKFKLQTIAS